MSTCVCATSCVTLLLAKRYLLFFSGASIPAALAMAPKRESSGTDKGAKRSKRMSFIAPTEFEIKAIDTVRLLAVDMVAKANSGHPG